MNTYDNRKVTLIAEATVTRGDRLKPGTAGYSGTPAAATETSFAIADHDAASGERFSARLLGPGAVYKARAAGAFAVGATLYAAAAGEVDDAITASLDRFVALEAAGAADQLVDVVPIYIGAVS